MAAKSAALAGKMVASRMRFFSEPTRANNMSMVVGVLAVCAVASSYRFSGTLV